jgi:hypothetical protein
LVLGLSLSLLIFSFPWREATRVQDHHGGDGSGYQGENSEALAPPPAPGPDELRRQAAKERIRERILREEAVTLALEAEVRRELMEELARSAGACAKGSEATPTPSLTMQIRHEVCFSSPVLMRIQFVGSFKKKKICWLILSRSRSVISHSQLFESLADHEGFRLWVALCYWGYTQFTRLYMPFSTTIYVS